MTEELDAESLEDARTGEIIPRNDSNGYKVGVLTQIDIKTLGTLELDEKSIEAIEEKLNPEDVQIRADGLVYLPWTWYNKRLNRVFGFLKWTLAPYWFPQVKNSGNTDTVVWINALVVKGVVISVAGGETSFIPNNPKMTYGDALEGARSNSLARNCKNLGMALELWDADWVAEWKSKYAETYEKNGRTLWRRKGSGSVKATSEKKSPPKKREPKPNPHGDPSVLDEEKSVDEMYPGDEEAPVADVARDLATNGEQKMSVTAVLKDFKLVKQIAKAAEKKDSETAQFIGKLDKRFEYTVSEIIKKLSEQE